MNQKILIYSFLITIFAISCNKQIIEPAPTLKQVQSKSNLKAASIGLKYYVAKTGNNSNSGTLLSPFLTIQKAANVAVAGDSIFIRSGVYQEQVYFTTSGSSTSPINVVAYHGESPIIDGGNTLPSTDYSAMILIWGNYLNISGLEVKNINVNGVHQSGTGIIIIGHHCTVSHINVHECWSTGILALGDYSIVEYCTVYNLCLENFKNPGAQGNGAGISSCRNTVDGHTDYSILRHNTVHDVWGEGISTFEATHTTIEDNTIYDNWSVNLYVSDATNCLVQRNFIYRTKDMINGAQVGIMLGDERRTPPSAYNTIIYNIIYGCKRNFMSGGMNNITVSNNTFINSSAICGVVIFDESMINSKFVNNIIMQDGTLSPAIGFGVNANLTLGHNLWSKMPTKSALGIGDIIGDPKFISINSPYSANSYKLLSTSPAINTGINVGLSTDFQLNQSIGLPDIGAFEYTASNLNSTVYYNSQITATATKNDCGAGSTGSTVTYTISAKKYSSKISQADADNLAATDLNTNKQAYANANGLCSAAPIGLTTVGDITGKGNGYWFANSFTASSNITVKKMNLYVGAASGTARLGIYSSISGEPGTLISQTGEFLLSDGWNSSTLYSPQSLISGVTYWFAIKISSPSTTLYYTTAVNRHRFQLNTYGIMPVSAPLNCSKGGGIYSIYAN